MSKFALLGIAACSSPLVLQGSRALPPSPPIAAETSLALPAVGEVRSDHVADGWPVWVVRRADGDVRVISGIAKRRRSGSTLFEPNAAIVRWFPHTRRFLASDVVYDENGDVLGYAATCDQGCPLVAGPAPEEPSLDSFEFSLQPARIVIAAPKLGTPGAAPVWHDFDQGEHVVDDATPNPGELVPAAMTVARALDRPAGTYAVVRGSIVRSVVDQPHLCAPSGTCSATSPPLLGLPPIPINRQAVSVVAGTMVVRREPDGLVVVAMNRD